MSGKARNQNPIPPGELEDGESRERTLNRFFEMSLDMFCVAGTDGYFKLINPAFDALGYQDDELLSQPFIDFVHPEDRLSTLEEVAKLANGVPTIRFENRYRCKDGTYRWLAWTSMPDENGKLYAVARDITEKKKTEGDLRLAQRQAEAAVKELEALSYSVSHDLRAPLRAIDGFSRALCEDYSSALDDEGRRCLERLRQGAKRMGQLIDDLLRLSRVNRGELISTRVDVSEIAARIARQYRENEPERQVEFSIQEGLIADTDSRLLTIALESLLQNAWKFTRNQSKARIEIGAAEEAGARVYFVRDNGAGFDMANAHRLFVAFQRLHSEAEFEGMGIGLAITQRIISRLGGRIWAESRPGAGATFRFTLA